MFKHLREDIQTVFERDPAAKSWLEVLLCYPGVHALIGHRLNHWLYQHRCFLLARILSQINRFFTGIEIHPGPIETVFYRPRVRSDHRRNRRDRDDVTLIKE